MSVDTNAESCVLYCGRLPSKVDEELLYELFVQAGPLERIHIPRGKDGEFRGFAFIHYKHPCSVPYALHIFRDTEIFGVCPTLQLKGAPQQHNRSQSLPTNFTGAPLIEPHLDFDALLAFSKTMLQNHNMQQASTMPVGLQQNFQLPSPLLNNQSAPLLFNQPPPQMFNQPHPQMFNQLPPQMFNQLPPQLFNQPYPQLSGYFGGQQNSNGNKPPEADSYRRRALNNQAEGSRGRDRQDNRHHYRSRSDNWHGEERRNNRDDNRHKPYSRDRRERDRNYGRHNTHDRNHDRRHRD